MTTFLSEVKGFTPVIDVLAQEAGLTTAVVYGVAWRYCQMEDGVCKASLETIGERVGISPSTSKRHMKKLCELGYLKDMTPNQRHAPHVYQDTGKAKIIGMVEARVEGGSERPTSVSQNDLPRSVKMTDKDSSKESNKDSKEGADAPSRLMFSALAHICRMNLKLITVTQRRQLNQTGKILREADITPDDLTRFEEWWTAHDWRGRKGDAPRPAQVREEWGTFTDWRDNGTGKDNVVTFASGLGEPITADNVDIPISEFLEHQASDSAGS